MNRKVKFLADRPPLDADSPGEFLNPTDIKYFYQWGLIIRGKNYYFVCFKNIFNRNL